MPFPHREVGRPTSTTNISESFVPVNRVHCATCAKSRMAFQFEDLFRLGPITIPFQFRARRQGAPFNAPLSFFGGRGGVKIFRGWTKPINGLYTGKLRRQVFTPLGLILFQRPVLATLLRLFIQLIIRLVCALEQALLHLNQPSHHLIVLGAAANLSYRQVALIAENAGMDKKSTHRFVCQ